MFFSNPEKMLERFFGPESDEDRAALARIDVSAKEERQIGEGVFQAFANDLKRQKIDLVSRGRDVEYLRALVERLRPSMAEGDRYRTIRVYVAKTPRSDARSFPDGILVFFEGLLNTAGSEAAIVGVAGHELSHLDRGHQLARTKRWKLVQQKFSAQGGPMRFDQFLDAGASMARLWTRPFRPEDEMEADRDGVRWSYTAGYDPQELARMLQDWAAKRRNPAFPLPEFLQSHPDLEVRRKAILDLYADLQKANPKDDLYVGRENLRRRVPRSQREFKE